MLLLTNKVNSSGQSGQTGENCKGMYKKWPNSGCTWVEEFTTLLELLGFISQKDVFLHISSIDGKTNNQNWKWNK